MDSVLILTVSGPDRPGLVDELSRVVASHGGNWEHCRMAHLNGRFAGLLQVRAASGDSDALARELRALPGLEVTVAAGAAEHPPPDRLFHIEIVGGDHPGIVRDIFSEIAAAGINVEELGTDTVNAPESGEILFKARARLGAPAGLDIHTVLRRIEAVAEDVMVDVRLTD
jgi:glycine cleavage system regulatory protein